MARFLKSRIKAKGAAPGSFIFMGNQLMDAPRISLFQYNNETATEKEFKSISEALEQSGTGFVNWLNIDGLHDTEPLKAISRHFNISPLAFENILDTGQRSKFFEDKNSLTVLLKVVYFDDKSNKISIEQISFIICNDAVISFQEKAGDYFDPVRERIRNALGRIRTCGTDYLLYSLMDSIVDNNLIIVEQLGDRIEQIEAELEDPDNAVSKKIFHYKTEVSFFRKSVRPLKEVMTRILRSNTQHIQTDTVVYYLELNDLIEHLNESIDAYYLMVSDQLSIYNTNVSNRANDVMKILTIFASIFIPLTFITGVYGTNFDNLPELHLKYGYFGMWGVMIIVAGWMLYYFRKHKWF